MTYSTEPRYGRVRSIITPAVEVKVAAGIEAETAGYARRRAVPRQILKPGSEGFPVCPGLERPDAIVRPAASNPSQSAF